MKQRLKRCIAGLLALVMVIGAFVTGIPKGSASINAAGNEPEYMAKIQSGTSGYWLFQTISATPEKTYRFTCDYYVESMSNSDIGHMAVWNGSKEEQKAFEVGTVSSMDISFTTTEDWLGARFYIASSMKIYICNVRLTEAGSSTNLLTNGDFKEENGTWIGWTIENSKITDKAGSEATKATHGTEIVPLDENIFPQQNTTSETPKYMAKIESGAEQNWFWILQGTSATAGKTYTFECDYYVADGQGGNICIWSDPASTSKAFETGDKKHIEVSVAVPDGNNSVNVRFEIATGTTMYIWNASLTEEGSNANLLNNGDFAKENGTWIDWTVGSNYISDKAGSEATKGTYGTTILPYDSDAFKQPEEPEDIPDVQEGIPTGTPEYMAKIQLKADTNWLWIYQSMAAEAETTYRFTCNYYVKEGEGGNAAVWSGNVEKSAALKPDTQGTIDIAYKTGEDVTGLAARLEIAPGTTIYVWNVCLREEGGIINLLTNGSFQKANGSWIGWSIGQSGVIKDKVTSDEMKAVYGTEILKFDSSILPQPEVPEKVPTGDPKYMAKLVGTHTDASGKEHTYVNVMQTITPEEGKTYVFSCNYYDRAANEGASLLLWSDKSKSVEGADEYGRIRVSTTSGEEGTLEITYTAQAGDTYIGVSMECDPDSEVYMWNLCLREKDSDVNLLKNAGFTSGDGSWINWSIAGTKVKDKTVSNEMTATYGHEIVAFNRNDIDAMKKDDAENHDIGSIPTGDPKYMAHIIGSYKDSTGQMHTYVNVRQGITPEAGKTYVFSCNYYDTKQDVATASILLWSDTSKGSEGDSYGRFRATTKAGEEGRLEIEYTATEGDTYIAVSMECEPDSEVYMWNLCLMEKGTNKNLLKNGSFKEGDGSWIGWSIGEQTAMTTADSDNFKATYGHEVVAFDRKKIDALKAEDAALLAYVNPNIVFNFDDVNKYKTLDSSLLKVVANMTDDNAKDEQKKGSKAMLGIWIGTAVVLVGGLGAIGTVLFVKKKKHGNIKQ